MGCLLKEVFVATDMKLRSNEMTREELMEEIVFCSPKWKLSLLERIEISVKKCFDYNEAQLKAKDEEIERLKAESKQSYIEGSKSCDDFIQHLHKQIEELSK